MIDHDIRTQLSRSARQMLENACQLAEPELGGSTTAASELGQTDGVFCFVGHPPNLAQLSAAWIAAWMSSSSTPSCLRHATIFTKLGFRWGGTK